MPAARSCTSMPAWRVSPAAWCSASAWDTAERSMPPHNLTLTLIGASLLWVGWFGFNAGSAGAADGRAGMAMLVTQMATAAAALELDVRGMGQPRQAQRARHRLGRGRGLGGHYAGVRLRRSHAGGAHRRGGGGGMLHCSNLAQACAGLRRLAGRLRRAWHRRHRRRAAHRRVRQQGNQRSGQRARCSS